MSSAFDQQFAYVAGAFGRGRLAPSILVVGDPEGLGASFARQVVRLVFCQGEEKPCGVCDACGRLDRDAHPDVYRIEPSRKSRVISVDQIRELIERLSQTSFAGGWKAALLLHADRMNPEAMNAFLKTLEEPPRWTLLILVTRVIQALLPTIVSRCQRINLGEPERPPQAPWKTELEEWLARGPSRGAVGQMARAAQLLGMLERIRESIERTERETSDGGGENGINSAEDETEEARRAARVARERGEMLRMIQLWQRDVLALKTGAPPEMLHFAHRLEALREQAAKESIAHLLRRVRAVDDANARLSNNLQPLAVFEAMVREGL